MRRASQPVDEDRHRASVFQDAGSRSVGREPGSRRRRYRARVVRQLRQQSGKNLLVLGSASLARTLISAGLVDEYVTLASSRVFRSGVVGLHYTAAAPS